MDWTFLRTLLGRPTVVTHSEPDGPRKRECLKAQLQSLPDLELAEILIPSLQRFIRRPLYPTAFTVFERSGIHVTPAGFYEPIPVLQTLSETIWEKRYDMTGVDMREEFQLQLLREAFPQFSAECNDFPLHQPDTRHDYYLGNGMFDGVDGLTYYCLIRHFAPNKVLEVGAGFSTLVALSAAERNSSTKVSCIDPYPPEHLLRSRRKIAAIVQSEVQSVDMAYFDTLEAGDFLFIDSSHCSKIGSDVNFLLLEVLPRLRPGVFIHLHDIFIPFEPFRDAVEGAKLFWNEQYMLHAFLQFNSEFEVVLATRFLGSCHEDDLRQLFPNSPWYTCGGSFWIRRKVA